MAEQSQADLLRQADELYERYGVPLETEHWGEYAAIDLDGRVVLAATLGEAVHKAGEILSPENIVFKVGERVTGLWL